jgi:putative transcriptional regulator
MTDLQIGNNLRRSRFSHDEMTQAKLAEIVGVTRQTIVALETGRYAPSLELAMKLAAAFACSVDELFFWKDTESGHAAAQARTEKET